MIIAKCKMQLDAAAKQAGAFTPRGFAAGICVLFFIVHFVFVFFLSTQAPASVVETIDQAQPKIVKIYGAGGFRGMESYQTGILISSEGHILTVFSYVLDTDYITAVLADGRKFDAKLLGADPRLELAVLKIEATALPCFDLSSAARVEPGDRVLALSNLFGVAAGGEPASVQSAIISAITHLEGRRGTFETPYRGPIYVLDAGTNNPGAAGGAVVSLRGELVGMLGKELRNALNNTWLNYAMPIDQLRSSVEEIKAGRFVARNERPLDRRPAQPADLASLGIALIPDVLERTPPFIDFVLPQSPAADAGLRPDDLIVLVGDRLVQSRKALAAELEYLDRDDPLSLTVLRGQELLSVEVRPPAQRPSPKEDQP